MSEHTEGKLEVCTGGLTGPTTPKISGSTVSGKGWPQTVVCSGMTTVFICPDQPDENLKNIPGSGEANAARLALCWNEHERLVKDRADLVEALEEVMRFATGSDRWDPDIKNARALLSRIETAKVTT